MATMPEECIHGLETGCTICSGKLAAERRQAAESPHPFFARYPGHCLACDLPIYPGQMIVVDGGPAIHERCA